MTLAELVKQNPKAHVRLVFCTEDHKTGMLETTAEHAAQPNRSMRFWPPAGETAATVGWGMPWFYANEIARIYIL